MRLKTQAAGKTDRGIVRRNNEDNFGFDIRAGIFVVCDGMGGQAAGEVASRIAVDTVLEHFRSNVKSYPDARTSDFVEISDQTSVLANAIHLANRAIRQAAFADSDYEGMGCTIVAASVSPELSSIAHLGDSRIYLIRQGAMQQLTADHSLVMEQVRRGVIAPEDAEHYEMQNVILRALGSEDSVEPDLAELSLEQGDTLLLCTDGVWRFVREHRIIEVVSRIENLDDACQILLEDAMSAGSDDNVTCLLVRMVEQGWGGRLLGNWRAG